MNRCGSRGPGSQPPPLNPQFGAQRFAATMTPLHDVGKTLLRHPYTNPASAPAVTLSWDLPHLSIVMLVDYHDGGGLSYCHASGGYPKTVHCHAGRLS